MCLPHVELVSFIGPDDLLNVGDHGRAVEALAKRGADQGSRHGMVNAHLTVDVF